MTWVIVTECNMFIDEEGMMPTGAVGPFNTEAEASTYLGNNSNLSPATILEMEAPEYD